MNLWDKYVRICTYSHYHLVVSIMFKNRYPMMGQCCVCTSTTSTNDNDDTSGDNDSQGYVAAAMSDCRASLKASSTTVNSSHGHNSEGKVRIEVAVVTYGVMVPYQVN